MNIDAGLINEFLLLFSHFLIQNQIHSMAADWVTDKDRRRFDLLQVLSMQTYGQKATPNICGNINQQGKKSNTTVGGLSYKIQFTATCSQRFSSGLFEQVFKQKVIFCSFFSK